MNAVNDPKGEAGAKKAPMWLLPPVALEQTAWVAKLGADKYGPFNWRKTGVCATTYVSAIMRHLNAWRDGEDLDPESGISHIAHIATSCNILMDAEACGTLQDDRNKRPGGGMSAERAEAFRKLIEATPRAVLLADLESRLPSSDDHEVHVAAHNSHAADLLEADGRRMLERMGEPVELTSCPWIGLLDKDPFDPGSPPAGKIEIDGKLVDLPPVPEGYSRWVDRGVAWGENRPTRYGYWCDEWFVYEDESAPCGSDYRYIEAVKDGPVGHRFGNIRPGDYVEGLFVKDTMPFSGRVANVVDIRGTKLFQFLDRASITEDEIYSITRL